ncbi:MAG: hypothetical protein RIR76_409 [Verrucomicrobiota bacterium]|jgi:hypothetical protein|nr:hypothetical protein [Opitutaceae bacterium]
MKRHTFVLFVLAAVAAAQGTDRRRGGAPASSAAPAAAASGQGFEAFQLILERNIFNPTRVGRTRVADEEKPVRSDEITLVGIVRYGDRGLAVFHSSEASFRREVGEGGEIADFKVLRVDAGGVELQRGDQPLKLVVSQQIRRVEGGDWTVSAPRTPPADPRAGSGRAAEAVPVEIPANASEVLKRLMKQREQQLKK